VTKVKSLQDVTVATYPAYPEASIELRARPDATPNAGDGQQDKEDVSMDNENNSEARSEERTEETAETSPEKTEERSSSEEKGGLQVEDRAQVAEDKPMQVRLVDEIRSVRVGETRSLAAASSALAPTEFNTFVWDKLRAASVALASGIPVVSTDRNDVQWPQITADATPGWTQEGGTITASDPTIASLTATPQKLAALVQLTNELIDDSEPAAVRVVTDHVNNILAHKLDLAVYEGSGTPPEITGFKTAAGGTVSNGSNGGTLNGLGVFATAISNIETNNGVAGAAVLHPRTWNSIRQMVDTTGRPLVSTGSSDAPKSVFGVPVYLSSQLSIAETQGTATGCSSAYVYDTKAAAVVSRTPAEVELDRSRLFNTDMSEIRGKLRADVVKPYPTLIQRMVGIRP